MVKEGDLTRVVNTMEYTDALWQPLPQIVIVQQASKDTITWWGLLPLTKTWAVISTLYSSFLRRSRTNPITPHIPFILVVTGSTASKLSPECSLCIFPKVAQTVILLGLSIMQRALGHCWYHISHINPWSSL